MYESRKHPPLSLARFARRLSVHLALVTLVCAGSLLVGMLGYHRLENLSWTDAFLNASMLLGGMGPVNPPQTEIGKLFAGFYALYAGLVFLIAAGILFAPLLHRALHKFHWEESSRTK